MVFSSIIFCPFIYLFSPNWWLLITQSTDLHRSIPVFRRILCKAKEISLFCNGEETGCQSDLWTFLSRQRSAPCWSTEYETAGKGQAGRKGDLWFIGKEAARAEEWKHRSGDAARPAFPPLKTYQLFLLFLPHLSLSCSTANMALGFAVMSHLWFHLEQQRKWCFFQSYAQQLIRPHLYTAAGQSKPSRTWGWNAHIYLIANKNQQEMEVDIPQIP